MVKKFPYLTLTPSASKLIKIVNVQENDNHGYSP